MFRKNASEVPRQAKEEGHLASATYWLVLAVSLLLLAIHLLLGVSSEHPVKDQLAHLSVEFIKEVGFAGVVAFILIKTIEGFSRKQHEQSMDLATEKMKRNIFEVVFKNKLPNELYEAVEAQLLESKVVRRDFDALYSLTKLNNSAHCKEWVQMEASHSYWLENISSEPLTGFAVSNTIDVPNISELRKLCVVQSIFVNEKAWPTDEIKTTSTAGAINHFFKYEIKVDIPVGGRIKITLRDKRIMRLHDSNVVCATLPTIGMRLTVNVPSGDLSVAADSMHARSLEARALGEGGTVYLWHLPCGLLPYQGIYFQWRPALDALAKEQLQ